MTTRVPPRCQFERVAVLSLVALLAMARPSAHAQLSLSADAGADRSPPTTSPGSWRATPILFGGTLLFPCRSPQVHFNQNEMVRDRHPRQRSRSTSGPPRTGQRDLRAADRRTDAALRAAAIRRAGWHRRQPAPSFPVENTAEAASAGTAAWPGAGVRRVSRQPYACRRFIAAAPVLSPPPSRTSGTVAPPAARTPHSGSQPFAERRKPEGLNGIFIDFGGKRWFSSGPAIALDRRHSRESARSANRPSTGPPTARRSTSPPPVERSLVATVRDPGAAGRSRSVLVVPYSIAPAGRARRILLRLEPHTAAWFSAKIPAAPLVRVARSRRPSASSRSVGPHPDPHRGQQHAANLLSRSAAISSTASRTSRPRPSEATSSRSSWRGRTSSTSSASSVCPASGSRSRRAGADQRRAADEPYVELPAGLGRRRK